ncbi:MAG: hypothetical protein LBV05_20300 [Comamonas sp.]|jgi:hypothetical protein|uniref:hypothetical protein n=1 Tax=Comamonas sp. TaxID=34028 RepID=UPI00284271CF|nr:hypothetical protein [Comamonas sp.]MDR3067835.1 hypothetical protein [Comamonas sp.]
MDPGLSPLRWSTLLPLKRSDEMSGEADCIPAPFLCGDPSSASTPGPVRAFSDGGFDAAVRAAAVPDSGPGSGFAAVAGRIGGVLAWLSLISALLRLLRALRGGLLRHLLHGFRLARKDSLFAGEQGESLKIVSEPP